MPQVSKKLISNTPPQKSTLLNSKIISYLLLLLFITVISISLFICSSCDISQISHQENQGKTITNYELKSKETNIPTAAGTYSDNTVNWCIYSDGALVINGTNADTYNGHSSIKYSGTNLDLNKSYTASTSTGSLSPWYSYKTSIKTVEFAKITKPKSMQCWFYKCSYLTNINSTNLDTSAVTYMGSMFQSCSRLSDLSGLSDWNVSAVTDMSWMFYDCGKITNLSWLSNWEFSAVTNMSYMFYHCYRLTDLSGLSNWEFPAVTDMSFMFEACTGLSDLSSLSNWEFPAVTSMGSMFYRCSSLTDLSPLSDWEFPAVTSMYKIFYHCSRLSDLSGLSEWDMSTVKDMTYMFSGCSSLVVTRLYNWNPPKNVDTSYMFYNCSQLETIYCKYSWSPKSNTNMFQNCQNLKSETTGKTYADGYSSSMANPVTGLFTIPEPITYAPIIQKTILDENNQPITDWDFEPGQFTFNISSDDSGAPLPKKTEVQTDDNGQAIWPEIKYYDAGEYIYKIEEKTGKIPGMTYDATPHELKLIIKE